MLAQNVATEGFDFTMKTYREPCPLEAKVESSNAGEERCHRVGQPNHPWGKQQGVLAYPVLLPIVNTNLVFLVRLHRNMGKGKGVQADDDMLS